MNNNLTDLLSNLNAAGQTGKINVYSVKNHLSRPQEMYSIALPDNINEKVLEEQCEYLKKYQNSECVAFDPVNPPAEETYECLLIKENIKKIWENIEKVLKAHNDFKSQENKEKAKNANLLVVELFFNDIRYFLCAKQSPFVHLFKGKKVFFSANDKLKDYPTEDLFVVRFDIDFIISEDKSFVYIFNMDNFKSVFNYDDYLKEKVEKDIDKINDWNFMDSFDIIKKSIGQKNVYRSLSKVFENEEYMKQIKNVDPMELKRRLLEKSEKNFREDDFNGDKLVVTKQNLSKIMRMLAKGFKYNFFNDKAE